MSAKWGYDRGTPIDRYYIEQFLAMQVHDVRGRCLEMGDSTYTERFGAARVISADVLHRAPGNPRATLVADLADPRQFATEQYDCVIATQVLQYVYQPTEAVETLYRVLRPEGVVLATVPCITPLEQNEWDGPWYWSFTALSLRRLFETHFLPEQITIHSRGNVLAATAFLQGLAAEELTPAELEHPDGRFPLVACVRAVKRAPA